MLLCSFSRRQSPGRHTPLCTYECSRSYYGNELISKGTVGHDVDTVTCFTRHESPTPHPLLIPNASPVTVVCVPPNDISYISNTISHNHTHLFSSPTNTLGNSYSGTVSFNWTQILNTFPDGVLISLTSRVLHPSAVVGATNNVHLQNSTGGIASSTALFLSTMLHHTPNETN